MLDTETRRRIDTCRDILVGKVPDPKSQVEQITIALIYKFMDDMDAEAEELGGRRSFFANGYARYGWSRLMAPDLGGFDMLALYSEAIQKMNENPGVPPLFRDIFKNAFLPYRDPETLRLFLKEIDGFTYDHSERLGDAFEYLLSVLGSQGDAGQFRTPRHIIDFMVEVIAPKKHESILDPACGTAGFLISAWKHILRHNTGQHALKPEERANLAANIHGYDISPDMVRLSLVNLYLHGFTDPHIVEYDTLTSEEKWNETADVILANPPFMSPKGGIKPHKRFTVQATRSEVLFVDYIAEHLSPQGRAAVIVPEGIIFQSGTAYRKLREMLVKNSLVAVVSLPAGVFNPYAGVKTSVLILDRRLAKTCDSVLFVKISNDGFSLGAQRRAVAGSDLPEASRVLRAWLRGEFDETSAMATRVERKRIGENGEYNLSGERYGDQTRLIQSKWPIVSLGEISTFMTGGTPTSTVAEYYEGGTVPWLVSGDIHGFEIFDCQKRITPKAVENSNARVLPKDSVLIALNGQGKTRGTVALLRMGGATCNQSLVAITPTKPPRAISEFIFWTLRSMYSSIRALTGDTERSGLNIPILKSIQIPLPPLAIQQEIVAEIESYQKIIDGARQVVENYQPRINVQPDWQLALLPTVAEFQEGPGILAKDFRDAGIPLIRLAGLRGECVTLDGCNHLDPVQVASKWAHFKLAVGDILVLTSASFGRPAVVTKETEGAIAYTGIIRFRPKVPELEAGYLRLFLGSPNFLDQADAFASGAVIKHFGPTHLKQMTIPLPPPDTQRAIVAEIEAEQALVNANKQLIARFEAKINAAIDRVWGESSSRPPLP